MAIEVRHTAPGELREFQDISAYVFAASPEDYNRWTAALDGEHLWLRPYETYAAFVDGTMASTLGAHELDIRVNGRWVPGAAITAVGTSPQYRRRGLQRAVMTHALATLRDRGRPFAMLWASYGAIYQRYGYGLASAHPGYTFDPRGVVFREDTPPTGRMRLLPEDEALKVIPGIYEAYAGPRTLLLERDERWWRRMFNDMPSGRRRFVAVHEDDAGHADGYFLYSTAEDMGAPYTPPPDQSMKVRDFVPVTLEARRAMWHYIRAHDLVKQVTLDFAPPDDPTPLMLLEPRHLQTRVGDGMWARITDVAPALEARGYEPRAEGALTLAVRDETCPWNDAAVRVEVGAGEARVTPASGPADLTLPVAALASLYTGFATATALARAGRIEGDPDALRRADALFATAYAPHVMDGF